MDVYLVGLPMAQPTVGRGRSGHRMHTTANRFNVGLLVWAGRRGGGGLVPAGSEGVAAAPGRAARLPMNCSPGLQRKERRVRLTAMKAV